VLNISLSSLFDALLPKILPEIIFEKEENIIASIEDITNRKRSILCIDYIQDILFYILLFKNNSFEISIKALSFMYITFEEIKYESLIQSCSLILTYKLAMELGNHNESIRQKVN
jgi:hypothetical protein